jgi:hypothetical protein
VPTILRARSVNTIYLFVVSNLRFLSLGIA